MTWTDLAKHGLTKWAKYNLSQFAREKYNTSEKMFIAIRDEFIERMPPELKAIMTQPDKDFYDWVEERKEAAMSLLNLFRLAGEAPNYGFTQNGVVIPTAGTVANHWTNFHQMIEQLEESVESLEALKPLREDYINSLKKDVERTNREIAEITREAHRR